jgi:hypothetical protein
MALKPLFMRFAGPVIAAYLLHWGVWWLIQEAATLTMFALTTSLNWIADHSRGGFPRVEGVYLSARLLAWETASDGLLPIALGLLIGWCVLHRKRGIQSAA